MKRTESFERRNGIADHRSRLGRFATRFAFEIVTVVGVLMVAGLIVLRMVLTR
jgi:hypothetical protein